MADEFKKLKEFLNGRKAVTTQSLMDEFGYSELSAHRMMSFLMTGGFISQVWDVYQGGYPVLKKDGNNASAN